MVSSSELVEFLVVKIQPHFIQSSLINLTYSGSVVFEIHNIMFVGFSWEGESIKEREGEENWNCAEELEWREEGVVGLFWLLELC